MGAKRARGVRRRPQRQVPRVPARPLGASLDQRPRPPEIPHETRWQTRRGQVRAHQLGRGHRHHCHEAEGNLQQLRPRSRVHQPGFGRIQPYRPPLPPPAGADRWLPGRLRHVFRSPIHRSGTVHVGRQQRLNLRRHPRFRPGGNVRRRSIRHGNGMHRRVQARL